ncbi:zinc-ribbon domain-containing protein [Singulisphaera sp. GP187]|uniref:zinc-ribbon domain-containing protein n=1 Tax=Singulisphaera sp. GP187 TaxID=1882752 RepID=UPI0020B16C84|nr:zinc-ribbon domain-containing protein [Singulisphaera sp. GP187]
MPIKVSCSSCGRTGRVPDHAIGENVRCPGCGFRRRLSAADVVPEVQASLDELEILDDEPAPIVVSDRGSRDHPERATSATQNPPRGSRSRKRETSPRADEPPAWNPAFLGLGVGVGILSLSILLVVISNRASKPKPERPGTDKTVAQGAPPQPLSLPEPTLTSSPLATSEPNSPGLPTSKPSEETGVASEPGSDEPEFAKNARQALASSPPAPASLSNPGKTTDSRTEPPSGAPLSTAEIVA